MLVIYEVPGTALRGHMFGKAALPAAFLVSVAFADILDDASSAIAYHGIWNHDSNQVRSV